MSSPPLLPEVYSLREVARAAGVSPREVAWLAQTGEVRAVDSFLSEPDALRAVHLLRKGTPFVAADAPTFGTTRRSRRPHVMPFAASTLLHAGIVAALALATTLGLRGTVTEAKSPVDRTRLVFLALPGPGGGGGGGGRQERQPPARAELKGRSTLRSPVRTERRQVPTEKPQQRERPPVPAPVETPPDKPLVVAETPVPPVAAPVAPAAQEDKNQAGVLEAPPQRAPSSGPGEAGGSGSGRGAGMGEGRGAGVGPGEGGGTGGGPFRPGSGVIPPSLLREVKPHYTEEARRRGVEGDVVLEIVVRADGTVGDVKVIQGLVGGLDGRAVDAVRQWKFSPARRFGSPVDVLVEVAVEFKLR